MCKAVEEIRAEGREEGREQGLEQGLERGIIGFVQAFLEENMPEEQICEKLKKFYNLSVERACEIIYKVKQEVQ